MQRVVLEVGCLAVLYLLKGVAKMKDSNWGSFVKNCLRVSSVVLYIRGETGCALPKNLTELSTQCKAFFTLWSRLWGVSAALSEDNGLCPFDQIWWLLLYIFLGKIL